MRTDCGPEVNRIEECEGDHLQQPHPRGTPRIQGGRPLRWGPDARKT